MTEKMSPAVNVKSAFASKKKRAWKRFLFQFVWSENQNEKV